VTVWCMAMQDIAPLFLDRCITGTLGAWRGHSLPYKACRGADVKGSKQRIQPSADEGGVTRRPSRRVKKPKRHMDDSEEEDAYGSSPRGRNVREGIYSPTRRRGSYARQVSHTSPFQLTFILLPPPPRADYQFSEATPPGTRGVSLVGKYCNFFYSPLHSQLHRGKSYPFSTRGSTVGGRCQLHRSKSYPFSTRGSTVGGRCDHGPIREH